MNNTTNFRAMLDGYSDKIAIYIKSGNSYCTNIEFIEVEEGSFVNPAIRIDKTEAQILMDELWSCGVRPTEGSGSAGSLKATENHLQDMRTIAFSLLKEKE